MADVIVVGGGNAALCAALSAADEGVDVLLLERASRPFRGGNTRHTRNIRAAHDQSDDYVTGPYDTDEMYQDIVDVTQGGCDPDLTSLLVGESLALANWMWHHGIRWQKPLKGTLHLSRTNRFFLGGGKSLVNAYFETARKRGVEVRYEAEVMGLDIVDGWCRAVELRSAEGIERIGCRAVVVASGGFEANRWCTQRPSTCAHAAAGRRSSPPSGVDAGGWCSMEVRRSCRRSGTGDCPVGPTTSSSGTRSGGREA